MSDDNNYPKERFYHTLNIKKYIQELQGIASAIIYDNKVDDDEIRMLIEWVYKHTDIVDVFPIDILYNKLSKIFEKGVATNKDRNDILSILSSFAADPQKDPIIDEIFDKDCEIIFLEHSFMITGKFNYGQRPKVQEEISSLGGFVHDKNSISDLDYLLVGSLGNKDWKYSRFGTKIENVLSNRKTHIKNCPLIISEKQFVDAMEIEKKRLVSIPDSEKLLLLEKKNKLLKQDNNLYNKTFVLTGTLNTFTRDEACKYIELKGGKVTSSVTKKTDYLILGKDPGSKHNIAIKYNIPILNENEFDKLLTS